MRAAVVSVAAAGVLALAACSQSSPPAATAAAPPATSSPAVNALVCQHYARQYSWKQHLTFPTMADALKWEGYVAADGAEAAAGTKLARDLKAELTAMQDAVSGKKSTYKNGTVARDCGA